MKTKKRIDAKLVESYQSGNKEALAELVMRWHLEFCKKAFWIVKDADLAKDIAQESWQTIMKKINTLKDPNSFGFWAMRIVYSISLDSLRSSNKERLKLQELKRERTSIDEIYDDNVSLKRQLLRAIQNLPEQQQYTIKLFYLESYSLKDISKLLNISVGTVKSRLFHAREKLKLILKDKHYEN